MDPHFIMLLLKACEDGQTTLDELDEIARRELATKDKTSSADIGTESCLLSPKIVTSYA